MLGPGGIFAGRGVPLGCTVSVTSADHPGSTPGNPASSGHVLLRKPDRLRSLK